MVSIWKHKKISSEKENNKHTIVPKIYIHLI